MFSIRRAAAATLVAMFAVPGVASAAQHGSSVVTEHHRVLSAAQVVIILLAAFGLCSVLRKKLGWPALVGEISVGLLLGPTVFGRVWPEAFRAVFPQDPVQHALLDGFAFWGVFFLLTGAGLHINPTAALRRRRSALVIGILGVLIPWGLGYLMTLAYVKAVGYTPPGSVHIFAAFLGITMAISAMVIITRLLSELDLTGTHLGQTVLCAYAVNDVLAWVVFSSIFQAATVGTVSFSAAAMKAAGVFAGTAALLVYGPRLTDRALSTLRFRAGTNGDNAVIKAVFLFAVAFGVATDFLGLTFFYGVFLAGITVSENRAVSQRVRDILTTMAQQIMVPVYFIYIGLSVDFGAYFNVWHVVYVSAASIVLKYLGAWLSAMISGRPRYEWASIGVAFTPSGVTGIVLAGVALESKIIDESIVVAIVASALLSTLIAGPWLRSSLAGLIRRVQQKTTLRLQQAVYCDPNCLHELHGEDREAALKQLCRIAAGASGVAPDWRMLLAQVIEYQGNVETSLSDGVGFVHTRLAGISRPTLVLGWSPSGIIWRSEDERPIRLVMTLFLPKDNPAGNLDLQYKVAKLLDHLKERHIYAAHSLDEAQRMIAEEVEAVQQQTESSAA